jgi:hypothetical protein
MPPSPRCGELMIDAPSNSAKFYKYNLELLISAQRNNLSISFARILCFCAALSLIALSASDALAQETQPGDVCTVGELNLSRWTAGPENTGTGNFLVCDGAAWQPVMRYSAAGLVSIRSATTSAVTLSLGGSDALQLTVGTDAQRPGTPAGGMFRYNTTTTPSDTLEYYDAETAAWLTLASAASGGAALSGLTDATATNTIDSDNFAQVWNWSTLSTETALSLASSSQTTGTILRIEGSNNNAASTGTVAKINVTGASNAATAVMITNAGTGTSLRINDDGTDADTTPTVIDASGNMAIGAAAPASGIALDVGNRTTSIRPAVGTTAQQPTCDATTEGAVRYDSTLKTLTMCNGTSWVLIAASVSAGCTGPNAFSFTNVTNAPLTTVTTSNSITPSGCNQSMAVTVSGGGGAAVSVNNGAWTTSTSIEPGQSLRVRLTSSSSINTAVSAIVTIGSTVGTTWSVTTVTGNTRIFASAGTYNGNFGGLSGADTTCNTLAAGLGYGSYWKAVMSDSIENARDRLTITYPVVRASSTSTTIAVTNLWAGSLAAAIGTGNSVNTGTDSAGLKTTGSTCSDWTSASSGLNTSYGNDSLTNSQWISWISSGCNGTRSIYCIEQPDPGCSPSAFSFTNLTAQARSTLVTSNTITPSGCALASTASVLGEGSPQISINGGGWVTSGSFSPGNTIQVRLTTSSAFNASFRARVVIGATTSTWSTTTLAPTGSQIFTTSGTYNGNMGGLSGADTLCSDQATALGFSGTWKAVLSTSTTNAKDRFTLTYPVTHASTGVIIAPSNLWAGSLGAAIGTGNSVNTGTDSAGLKTANTCSDWTSASSGLNTSYGNDSLTDSRWVSWISSGCNGTRSIYCIKE